jgi:hypothetical protein
VVNSLMLVHFNDHFTFDARRFVCVYGDNGVVKLCLEGAASPVVITPPPGVKIEEVCGAIEKAMWESYENIRRSGASENPQSQGQ